APRIHVDAHLDARITRRLPFALTTQQRVAVEQLRALLERGSPMGVLLQGDVGTGKTAVAVYALLATVARGWQVAFLAPTELLAVQHYGILDAWLRGSRVRLALLTGSRDDEPAVRERLHAGEVDLVVGTHALLGQRTMFSRLGLVVI